MNNNYYLRLVVGFSIFVIFLLEMLNFSGKLILLSLLRFLLLFICQFLQPFSNKSLLLLKFYLPRFNGMFPVYLN